jgi:hypothetical protein
VVFCVCDMPVMCGFCVYIYIHTHTHTYIWYGVCFFVCVCVNGMLYSALCVYNFVVIISVIWFFLEEGDVYFDIMEKSHFFQHLL